MTTLLDANVLIALLVADHVHHDPAEAWFAGSTHRFATCPSTEGSLMRLLVREGHPATGAQGLLSDMHRNPRHEFWADSVSFRDIRVRGLIGHRQVTDAYLAQLARTHGGRLATFDRGLATLHDDVADLVDVTA